MNWNDLAATAKSTVRALHISGICKRGKEIVRKMTANASRSNSRSECWKKTDSMEWSSISMRLTKLEWRTWCQSARLVWIDITITHQYQKASEGSSPKLEFIRELNLLTLRSLHLQIITIMIAAKTRSDGKRITTSRTYWERPVSSI